MEPLFSVSLDVAGSTAIKAEILRTSRGDRDNVASCYADLFKQLFRCERSLYVDLIRAGVAPDEIFFVKMIGDEIWSVVKAPAIGTTKFNKYAAAIFRACLSAVSRLLHVSCFERALSDEEELDQNSRLLKHVQRTTQLKAFVDLIEHPAETNLLREEEFLKGLGEFLGPASPTDAARLAPDILERFAGVRVERRPGSRAVTWTRTDFIGFEIDRFFRCTKFVKRGEVHVGERLESSIRMEPSPKAHRFYKCGRSKCFFVSDVAIATFVFTKKHLSSRKLRGIGTSYSIFRVEDEIVPS